jgi:LmbE family N-acetylglucosaminyl deacetylase
MTEPVSDPNLSSAMVVVAHADDAEYGCSGTAAQLARKGWEVTYVLCTDGSKGSDDPEMTGERLSEIRRREQMAAARILGLKTVEFLDYPDSFLTPSLDLRKDIARIIRKHRPDVLICNSPTRELESSSYIGHPDHMAAAEAALSAVYPTARDRLTYPDLLAEGYEPHKVKEVWIMYGGGESNHVIALEEEDLEKSIAALKAHVSQVPPDVDDRVREWKMRAGQAHGVGPAETFRLFTLG